TDWAAPSFTRVKPTTSLSSGWPCWCFRPWPLSCMSRSHGWRACCARASSSNPSRRSDSEDVMNRRKFLGSTASLGVALAASPILARAAARELLVAEPVHSTGYLPMYIAMANGYFAESDITVKIVTIENGSGHTNAVLSGQAFAFIG